jgi:hypothetical protein
MSLEEKIARIQEKLRTDFRNEASVSQGVVLPVLHALGWPVFDPEVVSPEYAVESRRVDFALCYPSLKPKVFIEVKQVGQTDGADRQLFEYAFHEGVPMAVLTDGQEWHFFLPGEPGAYQERRVYKLDLLERDASESAERLKRYLAYETVRSGEALRSARSDYRNVSKKRQIQRHLPIAWKKLIEEKDDLLIELVADKVESLCGYKPDAIVVRQFLGRVQVSQQSQTSAPKQRRFTAKSVSRNSSSRQAKTERKKKSLPRGAKAFPPDGTLCRTDYPDCEFEGRIEDGRLMIPGLGSFTSFSAPFTERGKSVNGWTAWEIMTPGSSRWVTAAQWRRREFDL